MQQISKLILPLIILAFAITGCEKKNWNEAKSINTIWSYKDFLKEYPEGVFADSAHLKIDHFNYQTAKKVNRIEGYNKFLQNNPKDIYADSARFEIEKLTFKDVQFENTISAYERFLKEYPNSYFNEEINRAINTLCRERYPGFQYVRTVKIIVEQSYSDDFHDHYDINLPFKQSAAEMLTNLAGLTIVETDAEKYDCVLKISAKGKPKGTYYVNRGYMYTGATLSGIITIEVPGSKPFKKNFYNNMEPPSHLSSFTEGDSLGYTIPSNAIFFKTGSFRVFDDKLLELIGEIFGKSSMINAVKNYSDYESLSKILIRIGEPVVEPLIAYIIENTKQLDFGTCIAVEILGELKDPRAIEPLISLCEREEINSHYNLSTNTKKALRLITGQNFGVDYVKWRHWWAENKQNFIK